MFWKVELNRQGDIKTVEQCTEKAANDGHIIYVEAETKAEACSAAKQWFENKFVCKKCGKTYCKRSHRDELAARKQLVSSLADAKGYRGAPDARRAAVEIGKDLDAGFVPQDCDDCDKVQRAKWDAESEAERLAKAKANEALKKEAEDQRAKWQAEAEAARGVAHVPPKIIQDTTTDSRFNVDIRLVYRQYLRMNSAFFKQWLDGQIAGMTRSKTVKTCPCMNGCKSAECDKL